MIVENIVTISPWSQSALVKKKKRQKKQSFTDNRKVFWNHTDFTTISVWKSTKKLKWQLAFFKLKVQPFVCKSLFGCGLPSFEASDFSMKQLQLQILVKGKWKSNSSSLLHFSLLRWVCLSSMSFLFQAKPNHSIKSSVKQKLCALASSC